MLEERSGIRERKVSFAGPRSRRRILWVVEILSWEARTQPEVPPVGNEWG